MMRRRRRMRIQPRFFIFLIVLLLAVGAGVWIFLTPDQPVYVVEGVLEGSNTTQSVIVREETLVEAAEYGKIDYLVPEGEPVASGESIANIYKVGYSERIVTELSDLGQRIHDAQQAAVKDLPEDPIHSINTGIVQKLDEIASAVRSGDNTGLLTLEHELKKQISGRDAYLRTSVTPGTALVDLNLKYQAKLDELNKYKETVKASGAGTVSFYYDGLETLLTLNNAAALSYEDVQNILSGAGQVTQGQAKALTPLYRLVTGSRWYVLALSKEGEQDFRIGQSYALSFPGYSGTEYNGTVVSHQVDDKQRTIDVLEVNQDIGMLLNVRKADMVVGRRVEGLKVPANYVVEKDGQTGVIILNAQKQRTLVPVEVLASDGKFSIVHPQVENSLAINTRIYR